MNTNLNHSGYRDFGRQLKGKKQREEQKAHDTLRQSKRKQKERMSLITADAGHGVRRREGVVVRDRVVGSILMKMQESSTKGPMISR